MIQKSEMITQAEIDWLAKLAKSASAGGYVLDYNGEPCFDGDMVRVDSVDGTEIAQLCYDKELRRWYFLFQESERQPVDDVVFGKLLNDVK